MIFISAAGSGHLGGEIEIKLYSPLGRKVVSRISDGPGTTAIDISGQSSGLYLLKVKQGKTIHSVTIVKE
jgi:hypothetical protein